MLSVKCIYIRGLILPETVSALLRLNPQRLKQTINYELHATQIYCYTLQAEKQEQLARTNLNNQTARALTKLTINAIRQPKGRKAETEKLGSSVRTRRGGKTNATQLPKPSTRRRIQLSRVAMRAKKKVERRDKYVKGDGPKN